MQPQESSIGEVIFCNYANLSTKLRHAADFIATNPATVAMRSLRSIARISGISPTNFSRLARALGFENYEQLRELSRNTVGQQIEKFSEKADKMQHDAKDSNKSPFLYRQSAACIANIKKQLADTNLERLEQAVDEIARANRVYLLAKLGSTAIAEYCNYIASWFCNNWSVIGRNNSSASSALSQADKNDVFIVITKAPYAKDSITGAKLISQCGCYLIVITDYHSCPALEFADAGFIIPSDSPQFFSSYAATVVLLETIVGMVLMRSGSKARATIEKIEANCHRLEKFWV